MIEFLELMILEMKVETDFIPHGHCIFWRPDLLTLHVVSDSVIALAYFSIPFSLAFFVRKRADLAFGGLFVLFAAFIFLCGVTHLLEIWNVWHTNYYLEGGVKALTGVVSLVTAIRAWPQVFKAISFVNPQHLAETNRQLQREVDKRYAAEIELRKTQEQLEQRVAERTADLQLAKDELEREIIHRRTMEVRFKKLVDGAPNGFLLIGADGLIQLANPNVCQLFGYQEDELLGQSIDILVPGNKVATHAQLRKNFSKKPATRRMGESRDIYGVRKNGDVVPLEIGLSPVREHDKLFVIASVVDISHYKRTEYILKANNKALMRSNEELQQFAHIASHDLREPLRKILSFGKMLTSGRYGDLTDKGTEFVSYMLDAAERMQELLDSLLTYSHVSSKAQPYAPVDMNTVLEEVRQDLEIPLLNSAAILTVEPLFTLDADKAQLRQLLQNLISNSIKYADKSRRLEIHITGTKRGDGTCELSVRDNGIGFLPQYAEQIFHVFKRLHNRNEYAGTGMGLAICRKIVERHNGIITASALPGEGATFTVVLPETQDASKPLTRADAVMQRE